MAFCAIVLLLCIPRLGLANANRSGVHWHNASYESFEDSRDLAEVLVDSLQDLKFDDEIIFDLKKENEHLVNRTATLIVRYIIKREVDNYRIRRAEAIKRKQYSTLIMKLIDIAKDLPKTESNVHRIDKAHKFFASTDNNDKHDTMADVQVFHYVARLYDIMFTAPKILSTLGDPSELTPRMLKSKLNSIDVKPVHLGVALMIQYHLRNTVNFARESNAMMILLTKKQFEGPLVMDVIRSLAARLLPVAELIDVHLKHESTMFKDTCPSTWLGIVNSTDHNDSKV